MLVDQMILIWRDRQAVVHERDATARKSMHLLDAQITYTVNSNRGDKPPIPSVLADMFPEKGTKKADPVEDFEALRKKTSAGMKRQQEEWKAKAREQ